MPFSIIMSQVNISQGDVEHDSPKHLNIDLIQNVFVNIFASVISDD